MKINKKGKHHYMQRAVETIEAPGRWEMMYHAKPVWKRDNQGDKMRFCSERE